MLNTTVSGLFSWTTSLGRVKRSLIPFGLGVLAIMGLNCVVGITMYALYYDCDPLTIGFVQKPDKMMPFFVQDIAGHLKGMPHIFISSVFSAALITMFASLNALDGVVYLDYIKPRIKHTEKQANLIMRVFICACGVYNIVAGVIVEKFSSIRHTSDIFNWRHNIGFGFRSLSAAFWSVLAGMTSMMVIVVGAQKRLKYSTLLVPSSVKNCPAANGNEIFFINTTTTTVNPTTPSASDSFSIFDISLNWYATVGTAIVLPNALPLSYILPAEKDLKLDLKLLSPVVHPF